jgi:hypothetical protein
MNLSELEQAVYLELAESPTAPVYWGSAEIRSALNEGYEEISDASEWYERVTPLTFRARQIYYDLRGLGKTAVLTVLRVFAQPNVRWLAATHVRELDGAAINYPNYPQWQGVRALSRFFFMRCAWWLGFHPSPSGDGEIVRLHHTSLPPGMVQDGDEPGFPEEFHLGLVHYACYELRAREKETGLSLGYWQDYQEYEGRLMAYSQSRVSRDYPSRMGEEEPIR